jgi:hypothetical protein
VTLDELKKAVLEKIGAVPAGGPYPADDVAKVQEKYEGLHAELSEGFMLPWDVSEDDIPQRVQESLLLMLAFRSAGDFGVPEPRYTRLRLEGSLGDSPPSLAEKRLRALLAVPFVSAPAKTEYF